MAEHCDIAVVGAGPVGCLTALLAERAGFRVVLLDAAPAPQSAAPEGNYALRVVALAPAARQQLVALSAWPEEAAVRAQPYRAMQVWDAVGAGRIAFSADEAGVPELGHIVEVPVLQWALDQAVAGRVERWSSACFAGWNPDGTLALADGRALRAEICVGADGRDSRVRKRAGIAIEWRDYRARGVVAVLDCAADHEAVARQAFTPVGPLGLLPLASGQLSIVWSVPAAEAERLCALAAADFAAEVAAAARLEGLALAGERASFPLVLQHAREYVAEGVALVGDAAHVVHPLAGLGMNLGFDDAAALIGALAAAREAGRRWSSVVVLARYGRARRREVLPAIALIDGLHDLFGARGGGLRALRAAGLRLVDRQGALKRQFMRYALGRAHDSLGVKPV